MANPSSLLVIRVQPKIQAAVFEAYIAGLYRSYRTASSVAEGGRSSHPPIHGQACDYLDTWLRPLFTPLAEFAYAFLQSEKRRLQTNGSETVDEPSDDSETLGSTAALNQYCMTKWGKIPHYVEEGGAAGKAKWKVTCMIDFDDEQLW